MQKTNFHTHSEYCDGSGEIEDYIKVATDKDFAAIGFSSHSPVEYPADDWTMKAEEFGTYLEELKRLKSAYADDIEIYSGLELDWISEMPDAFHFDPRVAELDFRIGSVHTLFDAHNGGFYAVDGPDNEFMHLLEETFKHNADDLCFEYYARMADMIRHGGFDILGHMDLIKKKNRYQQYFKEDAPLYRKMIRDLLDIIAHKNIIVEINTGGIFRGAREEVYPAPWILPEMQKMDIPVQINADAHSPESIDFYFDEAEALLKDSGYKTVRVLYKHQWKDMPL